MTTHNGGTPQQYPPAPQPPAQQPQPRGNGFGVAALVLGIVAIIGSFIPILGLVAFILGPLAVIFGIIGVMRKFRPKGTSITGIILGAISIIIAGVMTALIGGAVNAIDDEMTNAQQTAASQETEAGADAAAMSTVLYEIESDADTAESITYMTVEGGNTGQEQANGANLPWSNEVELENAGEFDLNIFSLSAQAAQGATEITCRITVDGEVIAEQTSTGQFAVVSCSGS